MLSIQVTLLNVEPPVWRRLLVPATMTLDKLHRGLQVALGWGDQHLYEFEIARARYGPLDEDADEDLLDAAEAVCGALVTEGARFDYFYDFGDDWHLELAVEPSTKGHPMSKGVVCVSGERAGPPEDCGGPDGYRDLLEVLADPTHPEYAETRERVGAGFDPGAFSMDGVNASLDGLG